MSGSSSAIFCRVSYGGQVKTIALHPGIPDNELSSLLQAVFVITRPILGFLGEDGLVIPLSVACKSPEVVPRSIVTLVVPIKNADDSAPTSSSSSRIGL